MESEEDEDTTTSTSEPGHLLTVLKDNMEQHLSDSELDGNSIDDEDVEQNKENELMRTWEDSDESPIAKVNKFEHSKRKREEEAISHESGVSSQQLACSPKKLQKQNVLTSQSLNVSDTTAKSGDPSLLERFGYSRSLKTTKLDDHKSESLREKAKATDPIAVRPIEVIDIDSGYLSDEEMSTDGDTPTPTQSGVARLTPLSSGGNFPRMQGSAAGTKVFEIHFNVHS